MSIANQAAGYRVGYAGVSTFEQDDALQRDALTAAGCDRIFVEISGATSTRPALDAMFDLVRAGTRS